MKKSLREQSRLSITKYWLAKKGGIHTQRRKEKHVKLAKVQPTLFVYSLHESFFFFFFLEVIFLFKKKKKFNALTKLYKKSSIPGRMKKKKKKKRKQFLFSKIYFSGPFISSNCFVSPPPHFIRNTRVDWIHSSSRYAPRVKSRGFFQIFFSH